jgi:hypothetical protein
VLFDLQSPGRRRVVRVVFGGLALIFAISFVFLGVGTGGGGFSFSDLFGGGGGDSSTAFDSDIKAAEAKVAVNPNDTVALASLVQLNYSAANSNTDSNGAPTTDGIEHLRQAADNWNKYVKASKGDLSPTAAVYALNTFDLLARIDFSQARTDTSQTEALTDINAAVDDWKSAAQAQQVLIDKQPKKATAKGHRQLLRDTRPVPLSLRRYPGGRPGGRQGEAGPGRQRLDGRQAARPDQAARPADSNGDQEHQQAAAADPGRRQRDRWGDRRLEPAQRSRHRRPEWRQRRTLDD